MVWRNVDGSWAQVSRNSWFLLLATLALPRRGLGQTTTATTTKAYAIIEVDGYDGRVNTTSMCLEPWPCTLYLNPGFVCSSLPYISVYDKSLGEDVCAYPIIANEGDVQYIPNTGVATARCIGEWKGNGRCDLANNHPNENCEYDGGDCCLATCHFNCAEETDVYDRNGEVCEFFCGEQTDYLCLDDQSIGSPIVQWCAYGSIKAASECYSTRLEITMALFDCVLDNRSHGNELYASPSCGNRTDACTELDIERGNACKLPVEDCTAGPCCEVALDSGFIPRDPLVMPTLQEIYRACDEGKTEDDEPCFKYLSKCIQDNRAYKGGCCQCDPGWAGWRCRKPLCWPKCVHGVCVGPDRCLCDDGWKGTACDHPVCDPECISGQGVCVLPNECSCFYGWTGNACEEANSVPSCVNGDPVAPDLCECQPGWGGRLCDYPLCQSWPLPSTDCGMGWCISPYLCECEPGWTRYLPINATGFDIKPFWSVGQDITLETSRGFVQGDSRMYFPNPYDRYYNASNAATCQLADCPMVYDPRCIKCEQPPDGVCLECEPGFMVHNKTGRCERCSNEFPHCQLCEPVPPARGEVPINRCTHCDPFFVLQEGLCISDGAIEFNSPVYHVYKDQVNLTVRIQRSPYILEPSSALPIEVLVRTRDITARSRSSDYGGGMTNFEYTQRRINLSTDPYIQLPEEGPVSPDYNSAVTERVMPEVELQIRIYDDVGYFPDLRYFDIELYIPPEHITGHQGPLVPFLGSQDYETVPTVPWHTPEDFGKSPLLERQDVLTSARVFIWDRVEASAPNCICRGACQEWNVTTTYMLPRKLQVEARTGDGKISLSPRDRFVAIVRPMTEEFVDAVGEVFELTDTDDDNQEKDGIFEGEFVPRYPGKYKVLVEKMVPGVYGQYYFHRVVHRNPPNLPDTSRIDHKLDFYWESIDEAPAFARWRYLLHFDCIQRTDWPAEWPPNFGHAFAIVASPGAKVSLSFWNDGKYEMIVPWDAKPNVAEIKWDNCSQGTFSSTFSYFLCFELLFHLPRVDPGGMYAMMVELESPTPTLEKRPVYIQSYIWHRTYSKDWGWYPVQQGCLFTSGLDTQGSPFENFKASPGEASAEKSFVSVHPRILRRNAKVPLIEVTLYIVLRRNDGSAIIAERAFLYSLKAKVFTVHEEAIDLSAGKFDWDDNINRYTLKYTPQIPERHYEGDDLNQGYFVRTVHVYLEGVEIGSSPNTLQVFLALSDPFYTKIWDGPWSCPDPCLAKITPLRAGQYMWFRLLSADNQAVQRTSGGDEYEVIFRGPAHSPVKPDYTAHVTDEFNGSYYVWFEIQNTGIYDMIITLKTKGRIRGCMGGETDFQGLIVYDELDPNLTTAHGPGVDGVAVSADGVARVFAGQSNEVTITSRDTYDNQYYEGGLVDGINISLSLPVFNQRDDLITFTDNGDGTYTYMYKVCKAGPTHVHIMVFAKRRWQHIHGSPFSVLVEASPVDTLKSALHEIPKPVVSGRPTKTSLVLKDLCGNPPLSDNDGAGLVTLMRRMGANGTEETKLIDVLETGMGESIIFFTPDRTGNHTLSARIQNMDIEGSPFDFAVEPAGRVPPPPGEEWVLGTVGACHLSTFEVEGSPALAGMPARIRVTARDLYTDPLARGNDTFLLNLWRVGGPCPHPARCLVVSRSVRTCISIQGCAWDPRNSECRPKCEATGASVPYTLVDPTASVVQTSVRDAEYVLEFTATVAGKYTGLVSVLRPGALEVVFFDTELMQRRIQNDIIRGPMTFNWHQINAMSKVPSNRYFAKVFGWIRIDNEDAYKLYVESDGSGQLLLNGTHVLDFERQDGNVMTELDIHLLPGFIPLQINYYQWARERAADAFLRLSYSARSVPFQVVPENAIFYEDFLVQANNPFSHIVNPKPRIQTVAIEGNWSNRSSGKAGVPYPIRLHSIDKYGNVLKVRDPTASLYVNVAPQFVDAELESDVLVANRWRATPLANGSWDVIVRPDVAPAVYDLTFTVTSLEQGGVVFRRQTKIPVEPNDVHPTTSLLVCTPTSPQVVGTRVTCTVLLRDLERNDLKDHEVRLSVRRHSSEIVESAVPLPIVDSRIRQFVFYPWYPGTWTVEATIILDTVLGPHMVRLQTIHYEALTGPASALKTTVSMPDKVLTNDPFQLAIRVFDFFGNPVEDKQVIQVEMQGGVRPDVDSVGQSIRGAVYTVSPNEYEARMPGIDHRSARTVTAKMLTQRTNETLTYCPELIPTFGKVVRLSNYRALASVALLECLPGYERVSGNEALRCETAIHPSTFIRLPADVGGEWRDLQSGQASVLICQPKISWCPPLRLANSRILTWDWRRDVGSRASVECVEGYYQLQGTNDIVCGSRNGVGVWLTANGLDAAVPVVCAAVQHYCTSLESASLLGSHVLVLNISADRDVHSVAMFGCEPAYEPASGDSIVVCSVDGQWGRPEQAAPLGIPEPFSCKEVDPLCSDPTALAGKNTRVVPGSVTHRRIGGKVQFECVEGCEPGHGEAVCAISRASDTKGEWMNSDPLYLGQVEYQPLKCLAMQNWCSEISPENGYFVALTDEWYLGSIARFACKPGYEQSGGNVELRCGYNEDKTSGAWESLDGEGSSDFLRCEIIEDYCGNVQPVNPVSTDYAFSDGLKLGSVLSMSCSVGYEPDVPKEPAHFPATLKCRVGPGGVGQWATPDGLAMPSGALACRGVMNWCPELGSNQFVLRNGQFRKVVGGRRPLSYAILGCNVGFALYLGSEPLGDNLRINCTAGTKAGGIWLLPDGRLARDIYCKALGHFCPEQIDAFTNINGDYHQLSLEKGYYHVAMKSSENRSFGASAMLTCNPEFDFYYSFGHSDLVCGYNADGTGGAWRDRGSNMLPITFHCFYSGTPVSGTVYKRDLCFDVELPNSSLPITFGRTGTIMFWLKPYAWDAGMSVIQGDHGDDQWWLFFESPGYLVARITDDRGHVGIDISQNSTKPLQSWFHITFSWQLGLGLAGLGDVKLWVDGELAGPYDGDISNRLDHFTWVEPDNRLYMGGFFNETVLADFSNLRVWTDRQSPTAEIELIRGWEDPRCGYRNGVCEDQRNLMAHAHVEQVTNPYDFRFALFSTRPETQLKLRCDPGWAISDGDQDVECHVDGKWRKIGTTTEAKTLQCCMVAADWCPPVEFPPEYPGGVIRDSQASATWPCEPGAPSVFEFMGVFYDPCVPVIVERAVATYNDPLMGFGSTVTMSCIPGYSVPIPLLQPNVWTCKRGTFVPELHAYSKRVPGAWTIPGSTPTWQCSGIQGFCQQVSLPHVRVVSTTDSSRGGSVAELACNLGFAWDFGPNITVASGTLLNVGCEASSSSSLRRGGVWAVHDLEDITFSDIQCQPSPGFCSVSDLRVFTAYLGIIQPISLDSFEAYFGGELAHGSSARLRCGDVYEYSFGDRELVCAYNELGTRAGWVTKYGSPAIPLHCRDTRPTVPGYAWYENKCLRQQANAALIPHTFGSEGSIALWFRVPNVSHYTILWASRNASCEPDTTTTTTTSTSITTSTTTTSGNVTESETEGNVTEDNVTEVNVKASCQDVPGWSGPQGMVCGQFKNICMNYPNYLHYYENDGHGPATACCECGGGLKADTTEGEGEGEGEADTGQRRLSAPTKEGAESISHDLQGGEGDPDPNLDTTPVGEADWLWQFTEDQEDDNSQMRRQIRHGAQEIERLLHASRGEGEGEGEGEGDDDDRTSTRPTSTSTSTSTPIHADPFQCIGSQFMMIDAGVLQVQLDDGGVGAFAIPLKSLGLKAGEWAHATYTWSSSGSDASLFINSKSGPESFANFIENATWWTTSSTTSTTTQSLAFNETSDDSIDYTAQIAMLSDMGWNLVQWNTTGGPQRDENESFEAYLGLPPVKNSINLPPPAEITTAFVRAYDSALSRTDIATLYHFETPACDQHPKGCPDPRSWDGLMHSRVIGATSRDVMLPPVSTQPGTVLRLGCEDGYAKTGGADAIRCDSSGEWMEPDSMKVVTWLECCRYEANFCPQLSSDYTFVESWSPSLSCWNDTIPAAWTNTTILASLGAHVRFGCEVGYILVEGSDEIFCSNNWPFDASSGLSNIWDANYVNRGQWVDAVTLGLAVPPVCEADEAWCPDLQGVNSYVWNATLGQQLGSVVTYLCIDKFEPVAGSVTVRCVTREDGLGGRWINARGEDAIPLSCGPRLRLSSTATDQYDLATMNAAVDRRFRSNATLGCENWFTQIHGDNTIFCMLGPSPEFSHGLTGRWVDYNGDNMEYPVCELKPWCPPVPLDGFNSAVAHLTDDYNYNTIASLRCYVGYTRVSGNERLRCINEITGLRGTWDGPPLKCMLARHYCPTINAVNAYMVERDLFYKMGESATFLCKPGYYHVWGDTHVNCEMGQAGNVGEWKAANTGAKAVVKVCSFDNSYCPEVNVSNGIVAKMSRSRAFGSVVELRCHSGFEDRVRGIDRRTAMCLHNRKDSESGFWYAGMSHASRDLLRAISIVKEILLQLEEHEARVYRYEDADTTAEIHFEERWRAELSFALSLLSHQEHVMDALKNLPHDPIVGSASPLRITIYHIQALLRLLVSVAEEPNDISADEARVLFSAYDKLKVSFQDSMSVAPSGWLRDSGELFGGRNNGYRYGWKCNVGVNSSNDGAHNRNRTAFTLLENTLVATDIRSECDSQEWRIQLPSGRYRVEVTIQDTQYESLASGCMLQGEPLGFPRVVGPPGRVETRGLTVDVIDSLSLTADRDEGCSSINRIAIQSVKNSGVSDAEMPLLTCSQIPDWCQPLSPPLLTQIVSTASPQPLGGSVAFACGTEYLYSRGLSEFVCGTDPTGRFSQWRSPGMSSARFDLTCLLNRAVCVPLEPERGAVLTSVEPPSYQAGSEVTFACKRGYLRAKGHTRIRCSRDGTWIGYTKDGRAMESVIPLMCEPIPVYCPALTASVANRNPVAGLLGADEPAFHQTFTISTEVPIGEGSLGQEEIIQCPTTYHRIGGDQRFLCTHGLSGGVWQPMNAPTSKLVDTTAAEILSCELDTIHGVKRLYYLSAEKPHGTDGSTGFDVVPNIDQFTSTYDAAHFEAHLKAPHTGLFKFSIEVVGRFLVSLKGNVLLTGRSHGQAPFTFTSGTVRLKKSEYYELNLQYSLDPELLGDEGVRPTQRHVRLFWSSDLWPAEVIPPTAFFYGFEMIHDFPRTVVPFNDPMINEACDVDLTVPITYAGLRPGDRGFLTDGTFQRDYNPNYNCRWLLQNDGAQRINIFVEYFEIEESPECDKDFLMMSSVTYRMKFCGAIQKHAVIASVVTQQLYISFISDNSVEHEGMHIIYEIQNATSSPLPNVTVGVPPTFADLNLLR